jgi:hypothetical protein
MSWNFESNGFINNVPFSIPRFMLILVPDLSGNHHIGVDLFQNSQGTFEMQNVLEVNCSGSFNSPEQQ